MDAYMESPRSAKLSIDDTYSSSNNNFSLTLSLSLPLFAQL